MWVYQLHVGDDLKLLMNFARHAEQLLCYPFCGKIQLLASLDTKKNPAIFISM